MSLAEYKHEWYLKNKHKMTKYHANYYTANKAEILKRCSVYTKNYRLSHPWLSAMTGANSRCNNPKNKKFYLYGGKGIKQLMSQADFKYLWFRDKAYEMKTPSIDRIDSEKHYCLENCRFIEHSENSARAWRKTIMQYNLNGEHLFTWESATHAMKQLNINRTNICACARGI